MSKLYGIVSPYIVSQWYSKIKKLILCIPLIYY